MQTLISKYSVFTESRAKFTVDKVFIRLRRVNIILPWAVMKVRELLSSHACKRTLQANVPLLQQHRLTCIRMIMINIFCKTATKYCNLQQQIIVIYFNGPCNTTWQCALTIYINPLYTTSLTFFSLLLY